MSPVDSAIASGATSGVTTKAPSVVADGDLETFDDEDQFRPPQSAGGFSCQSFSDPQPGGTGFQLVMSSGSVLSVLCHDLTVVHPVCDM